MKLYQCIIYNTECDSALPVAALTEKEMKDKAYEEYTIIFQQCQENEQLGDLNAEAEEYEEFLENHENSYIQCCDFHIEFVYSEIELSLSDINVHVMDKQNHQIHKVGTDVHDILWVDDNGTVHYLNTKNGEGCGENGLNDTKQGYTFLPSDGNDLFQPAMCYYNKESVCGYPIDDCNHCPANPSSNDPYWGVTEANIK